MKQLRDHKAQGSALFTLVSGIVIVIAVIYFLIKLAGSGSFGDVAETTEAATQTRIQPVGQLKSVFNVTRRTASFPKRLNLKTKAIGRLALPKVSIPCSNTL